MPRLHSLLGIGVVCCLAVACQSKQPIKSPPTVSARPDGKYTFVNSKRVSADQLSTIQPGARCTVDTKDSSRSVTGWVKQVGPGGIVLVNAEEIVSHGELPSQEKGGGYTHTRKSQVELAVGEVASVRVFDK